MGADGSGWSTVGFESFGLGLFLFRLLGLGFCTLSLVLGFFYLGLSFLGLASSSSYSGFSYVKSKISVLKSLRKQNGIPSEL